MSKRFPIKSMVQPFLVRQTHIQVIEVVEIVEVEIIEEPIRNNRAMLNFRIGPVKEKLP